MINILSLRPISLLPVLIVLNGSFGNSFMQIKIGPATLNELFLLLMILVYRDVIIDTIRRSFILKLFFVWFAYSMLLLLVGLTKFGPISLRDATHQVDILTLFIVIALSHKFLTKSIIIRIILMSLLFEVADRLFFSSIFSWFTPFSGQPFFGGSIGSNLIVIAGFWIGVLVNDVTTKMRLTLITLSISLLLLMQNRYMYISLICTALLYLTYYKFGLKVKLKFLLITAVLFLSIEPIFTFFTFIGIDFKGITKYGSGISASGILEHLKTAFGYTSDVYKGADDGFAIRFLWWGEIIDRALDSFGIMFGGQGFGIPLTSGTHLKPVREPHNSMISIFARGGLVYLILWLIPIGLIFKSIIRHIRSRLGIALIFGLISTLIMSLVEPAFELPPVCILFYFFLGYLANNTNVRTSTS